MDEHCVTSPAELERLVLAMGFLPFFQNDLAGFSVEEHTPPELWFSDAADGPWEWKGPVARGGQCVYGKLFCGKAGFVSMDWFADFANYRRDGYDFEGWYEDGLAPHKDKCVYDTIVKNGSLSTRSLKALCNYQKGGNKGFDSVITRLQMQTFVNVADFEYMLDRFGRQYGWGMARYTTPEAQFGESALNCARSPAESKRRILEHLEKLLPAASEAQRRKLIG
ncbi:MAG: hypothetical protein PHD67_08375 [Oscillospiraceae bacterium]|nr:hypothetical protein [Oscillospiraceae bacterium]